MAGLGCDTGAGVGGWGCGNSPHDLSANANNGTEEQSRYVYLHVCNPGFA